MANSWPSPTELHDTDLQCMRLCDERGRTPDIKNPGVGVSKLSHHPPPGYECCKKYLSARDRPVKRAGSPFVTRPLAWQLARG